MHIDYLGLERLDLDLTFLSKTNLKTLILQTTFHASNLGVEEIYEFTFTSVRTEPDLVSIPLGFLAKILRIPFSTWAEQEAFYTRFIRPYEKLFATSYMYVNTDDAPHMLVSRRYMAKYIEREDGGAVGEETGTREILFDIPGRDGLRCTWEQLQGKRKQHLLITSTFARYVLIRNIAALEQVYFTLCASAFGKLQRQAFEERCVKRANENKQ